MLDARCGEIVQFDDVGTNSVVATVSGFSASTDQMVWYGGAAGPYPAPLDELCDPAVEVEIDIKPGSAPNSINLCSNGAVPVAILGSATLDVWDVDKDNLRFAEAAVKVVGKKDPNQLCSYQDINGDFIDDLVCHFVTTDIAGIDGKRLPPR